MKKDTKLNIGNVQIRQREIYAKRHPKADTLFHLGDKILLNNLKKNDKKGSWLLMPWIGPFVIVSLYININ